MNKKQEKLKQGSEKKPSSSKSNLRILNQFAQNQIESDKNRGWPV